MTKTGKRHNYYAGGKSANTVDKEILKDIMSDIKESFVDKEILSQMKTISRRKRLFNVPSAKSQKTDISVSANISLSIKPEYQKIMDLFIGRSFSLKNYSSNNTKYGVRVSLGNTDPLKAFIGVLTSYQEPQDVATKAYYASLSSYARSQRDGNNKIIESLNSSIFAIRYYYELTGVGLKIENNVVQDVDFLIVNNPNGRIAVKSTKDLIYQLLSRNNSKYRKTNNPWRDVHAYIKFDS